MSTDRDIQPTHIDIVDVSVSGVENGSNTEKSSDSGIETMDACSETFPSSSDSDISPVKSVIVDQVCPQNTIGSEEKSTQSGCINASPVPSPVSTSPDDTREVDSLSFDDSLPSKDVNFAKDLSALASDANSATNSCNSFEDAPDTLMYKQNKFKMNNNLAMSTMSLNEQNLSQNIICKSPYSRSAENISNVETPIQSSDKDLDKDEILSQFTSQKNKVVATQIIPDSTNDMTKLRNDLKPEMTNLDLKYPRIPKEILSQDIGSIVKNVHGIFSSVSGSLKYAYNQRSVQKPVKNVKPINGKVMNDIFEDDSNEVTTLNEKVNQSESVPKPEISISNVEKDEIKQERASSDTDVDVRREVSKLQVESLEKLLFEQRKENAALRERVKQQCDEMDQKEQTFRELEVKLDLMNKRVEQAEREKDAAVMRYASVECGGIEARRAADAAARAEKAAQVEVELLNGKLRSAHGEKQRIIQLYDDKCHEVQDTERELARVREELKELEGRLKWTQSKLRVEMDAYKDSSERVEKLTQQVSELEAARDAAAASATDSAKAKQFEAELKECRAALILCRHEREDLERRLTSTTQLLETCRRERDSASTSLVEATAEVEQLKLSNFRLEEEAAELAALRAKAALADTLSAQLHRESERAAQAEEALSGERAAAETCGRREAAALEHAARLTAQHVAQRAAAAHYEAKAQALSADNASLRERVTSLEAECTRLQAALNEETERRNKENRVLARKVAELTEEAAEATKRLEWEKGENGVLKKKHASAIKELNRELQRALKRCEQLEAKLPPPDAPSTRTGSISSLSSVESAQTEEKLHNGHADSMPDIQVREPDRQALIERIVSLQRAAARRAERCEFLEEHSKQLTSELRNKARLLRHLLSNMPAGAVASEDRDINKKEIARHGGGAMAALWGGDPAGLTLELSLEMNKRLQALLEDTLLKNITLKENMDTLGAEISRLKEQRKSTDAK